MFWAFATSTFAFWIVLPEVRRWAERKKIRSGAALALAISSSAQARLVKHLGLRLGLRESETERLSAPIWVVDSVATTFDVERVCGPDGKHQLRIHLAVSVNDPLSEMLTSNAVDEPDHPFWFVAAHEAAHVRRRDLEWLRFWAVAAFGAGIWVRAWTGSVGWGLVATGLFKACWNWESRRREWRADGDGWHDASQTDFVNANLARGALAYFGRLKKMHLEARRTMALGRWFFAANGDCRLDVLHPSLNERLDAAHRACERGFSTTQ